LLRWLCLKEVSTPPLKSKVSADVNFTILYLIPKRTHHHQPLELY